MKGTFNSGDETWEMIADISANKVLERLKDYDKKHGTSFYIGNYNQFIKISGMFEDDKDEESIFKELTEQNQTSNELERYKEEIKRVLMAEIMEAEVKRLMDVYETDFQEFMEKEFDAKTAATAIMMGY
jgi:hypothetical protein